MSENYRILMPVVNAPVLVERKVTKDIPDLTKLILVNNFDHPKVEYWSKFSEDKGAEVHRYPRNLGAGGSVNLGLRRMVKEDYDFLIILTPSAELLQPLQILVDELYKRKEQGDQDAIYIASNAQLHCFAMTQKTVEIGGYFDENFWPSYFADTDYYERSKYNLLRGVNFGMHDVVKSIGSGVSGHDRRIFRLWQYNAGRVSQYFVDKWGGHGSKACYKTPFNNPKMKTNDWTVDPSIFTWHPGIYEGNFTESPGYGNRSTWE